MSEIHVPCPACETRIRFRSGLPNRENIDCPQCGETIPLRRSSRPRRPVAREDEYDQRGYEAPPRRSRVERPAPAPARRSPASRKPKKSQGHSAGLWYGVIGGSVGVLGLILGLIFFVNSNRKQPAPSSSQEILADATDPATTNTSATNPNPTQQFVANLLPTTSPAPSQPATPLAQGGPPMPTLNPGPDGVIPAPAGTGQFNADANAKNRLKYGWKSNQEFAYRTTITAEIGNEIQDIRGLSTYEVLGHDPAMARILEDEEEEEGMATGTGFVVHPDGYLMTCAHVVEGGAKIEVELGNQTYAARVVEVSSQRDLALIQIAARNLPVLPLEDSSRIELAQHVRLVGFPLSSVLGTSVKVTQGSVAGFIDRETGRMIQVDASMNPGNSGGPLVNDRGEVIGVASSGYFGSEISEVGLAIPSNDVAVLLRKNGVTPTPGGANAQLDGPALAKRVTPSVAFLKVTIQSTPKESLALKHFSTFTTNTHRKDGRSVVGSLPSSKSESGKLLVNEEGHVLHAEGTKQPLPFGLGPLSHLAFNPISSDGETSWGTHRLTTITQVQRNDSAYDPYSRFGGIPGSRYGRPRGYPRPPSLYGPSNPTEVTKVHLALELSAYELAESTPETQNIKKSYEFQTLDDAEEPYFRLSGTGNIRFHRTRSLPEHIHYQLQLQLRQDNGSIVRVPIDVLCVRLTDTELEDYKKGVAEAAKKFQEQARANPAPANPPSRPAVPVAETLDQHLGMLRNAGANFSQKYNALNAIMRTAPEEKHRKEVLDAVEPMLKDSNGSLQTTAIKVFGVWGTESRTTVLIEMAGGFSLSHRWEAMKALGKIGGKKSAEAVVKRLTDSTDMLIAAAALKEMGSVAEEPVLKLIDHSEQQVRYQVYHILGKVGGAKSEAALKERSQSDASGFNRAAAQNALRGMQRP